MSTNRCKNAGEPAIGVTAVLDGTNEADVHREIF
jgi:hypothetical protein